MTLMGVFLYFHSIAFLEDLPLSNDYVFDSVAEFYAATDRYYTQNAHNCWIAAAMYGVTLVLSIWQYNVNNRAVNK